MLRATKQFENDRVEVTLDLEPGEDPVAALEVARKQCDDALAVGRDASLRDKMKQQMSTPEGRAALERFLRLQ
jgi:hypothetical protein